MGGALPLLSVRAFVAWTGDNFTCPHGRHCALDGQWLIIFHCQPHKSGVACIEVNENDSSIMRDESVCGLFACYLVPVLLILEFQVAGSV
jgi:hypothetical protein